MKNIATLNPSLKKAYRQLENLGYTKDYLIISFYKNYLTVHFFSKNDVLSL